jgi:nucleoside triphosphate diphosphatase
MSILDDIDPKLSSLAHAAQVSERAAATGFDWANIAQIRYKLDEEIREFDVALTNASGSVSPEVIDELGDLFIVLINLARHLRLDTQAVVRQASDKFATRFKHMEYLAQQRSWNLQHLSPQQWDELWCQAKRQL